MQKSRSAYRGGTSTPGPRHVMKILALDLSSSCSGYAVFQGESLVEHGSIEHEKGILEYGPYPFCYLDALGLMVDKITTLVVDKHHPDTVVIEETNKSRARYSQKALEMLHALVLQRLRMLGYTSATVKYISTGVWRRAVGIELTKEERRQNAKLSAAKRRAKLRGVELDKKALGIAGKVTKKHAAVAWANTTYGLKLLKKHEDVAEAIALGTALIRGAAVCDGK